MVGEGAFRAEAGGRASLGGSLKVTGVLGRFSSHHRCHFIDLRLIGKRPCDKPFLLFTKLFYCMEVILLLGPIDLALITTKQPNS